MIYHIVLLEKQETKARFCRTLLSPETKKPADFFAKHIKRLLIASIFLDNEIVSILKICRGVETLVIWARCHNLEVQELLSASEPLLTPTRLSVFSESFTDSQYRFHYPIFHNVTHLDLVCDDEDSWNGSSSLAQLTKLTHLSLDVRYFVQSAAKLARDVLDLCQPSVCILILWLQLEHFHEDHRCFGEVKAIFAGEIDIRVVLACMGGGFYRTEKYASIHRGCDDMLRDWGVDSTTGFWKKAEAIVEGRRRRVKP